MSVYRTGLPLVDSSCHYSCPWLSLDAIGCHQLPLVVIGCNWCLWSIFGYTFVVIFFILIFSTAEYRKSLIPSAWLSKCLFSTVALGWHHHHTYITAYFLFGCVWHLVDLLPLLYAYQSEVDTALIMLFFLIFYGPVLVFDAMLSPRM